MENLHVPPRDSCHHWVWSYTQMLFYFFLFIYFICLVEGTLYVQHMHLWRLEKNFQEPIPSFYHVDPGIDLNSGGQAWHPAPHPPSHLPGLGIWTKTLAGKRMIPNAASEQKIFRSELAETCRVYEVYWGLKSGHLTSSHSPGPQKSSTSHIFLNDVPVPAPASVPCRGHTQCSKPIDIFTSSAQFSSLP